MSWAAFVSLLGPITSGSKSVKGFGRNNRYQQAFSSTTRSLLWLITRKVKFRFVQHQPRNSVIRCI